MWRCFCSSVPYSSSVGPNMLDAHAADRIDRADARHLLAAAPAPRPARARRRRIAFGQVGAPQPLAPMRSRQSFVVARWTDGRHPDLGRRARRPVRSDVGKFSSSQARASARKASSSAAEISHRIASVSTADAAFGLRFGSGRPRMRLEMMLFCTSEEPPSIESALPAQPAAHGRAPRRPRSPRPPSPGPGGP